MRCKRRLLWWGWSWYFLIFTPWVIAVQKPPAPASSSSAGILKWITNKVFTPYIAIQHNIASIDLDKLPSVLKSERDTINGEVLLQLNLTDRPTVEVLLYLIRKAVYYQTNWKLPATAPVYLALGDDIPSIGFKGKCHTMTLTDDGTMLHMRFLNGATKNTFGINLHFSRLWFNPILEKLRPPQNADETFTQPKLYNYSAWHTKRQRQSIKDCSGLKLTIDTRTVTLVVNVSPKRYVFSVVDLHSDILRLLQPLDSQGSQIRSQNCFANVKTNIPLYSEPSPQPIVVRLHPMGVDSQRKPFHPIRVTCLSCALSWSEYAIFRNFLLLSNNNPFVQGPFCIIQYSGELESVFSSIWSKLRVGEPKNVKPCSWINPRRGLEATQLRAARHWKPQTCWVPNPDTLAAKHHSAVMKSNLRVFQPRWIYFDADEILHLAGTHIDKEDSTISYETVHLLLQPKEHVSTGCFFGLCSLASSNRERYWCPLLASGYMRYNSRKKPLQIIMDVDRSKN